jgi:hypothetical protein
MNCSHIGTIHEVLGSLLKRNGSVASLSENVKAKTMKNKRIDILGVPLGAGHLGW